MNGELLLNLNWKDVSQRHVQVTHFTWFSITHCFGHYGKSNTMFWNCVKNQMDGDWRIQVKLTLVFKLSWCGGSINMVIKCVNFKTKFTTCASSQLVNVRVASSRSTCGAIWEITTAHYHKANATNWAMQKSIFCLLSTDLFTLKSLYLFALFANNLARKWLQLCRLCMVSVPVQHLEIQLVTKPDFKVNA